MDKNIKYTTTYDVIKNLDFVYRDKIYKNALNKTKKAYAEALNIDVKDKTPTEIDESITKEQQMEEHQKVLNILKLGPDDYKQFINNA